MTTSEPPEQVTVEVLGVPCVVVIERGFEKRRGKLAFRARGCWRERPVEVWAMRWRVAVEHWRSAAARAAEGFL
jgi:hypothetical protein